MACKSTQEAIQSLVDQFDELSRAALAMPSFSFPRLSLGEYKQLEVNYNDVVSDNEPTIDEAWAVLGKFKANRELK